LVDDVKRIDPILSVVKDIRQYSQFKSIIKTGITIGINDLPFEKAMIFSWIEEELNVRKD
jgi:hypothetical protein